MQLLVQKLEDTELRSVARKVNPDDVNVANIEIMTLDQARIMKFPELPNDLRELSNDDSLQGSEQKRLQATASKDREHSVRYLAKDEYDSSLSLHKADEREGHRMIKAAIPPLVRKQVETSSAHGAYNGRRLQTYELLQVDCIAWVANRPAAKDAWCR